MRFRLMEVAVMSADVDLPEALELVREYRDLFERLAESDLPISADAKRGLDRLESEGENEE